MSRSWLNHQIHWGVANSTSSSPFYGPRCRITSVMNSPITDSASACEISRASTTKAQWGPQGKQGTRWGCPVNAAWINGLWISYGNSGGGI